MPSCPQLGQMTEFGSKVAFDHFHHRLEIDFNLQEHMDILSPQKSLETHGCFHGHCI